MDRCTIFPVRNALPLEECPPGPPTAPDRPRPPPQSHAGGAGLPPELAGAAPRPRSTGQSRRPVCGPRPSGPLPPAFGVLAPPLAPPRRPPPFRPSAISHMPALRRPSTLPNSPQSTGSPPPAPQRPPRRGAPAASPSDPRAGWRGPSPRGQARWPRGPRDRRRHVAAEPLALALRRHAAAHPAVPAVPRAPSRSVWPDLASLHTHRPRFFAIW